MVDVPSREEFDALIARVTDLEATAADHEERIGTLETGTLEPVPPPSGEGVQAKRVYDALGSFGVNTFSSMAPDANLWGSYPADYSPGSVIDALTWLTGHTGHTFRIREYHYASRESMQKQWMQTITAALPDTRFAMCVAANGAVADAQSLARMPGLAWVEGLNEPNTDFGSGMIPFEQTLAIQDALQAAPPLLMGPSIVAGMPHPEGWVTQYCGTEENLAALNARMVVGNGHLYPPDHPDAPGSSLAEYVGGLWTAYAQQPIALTEYHPSLYNAHGQGPGLPGWSGERDAFWTLCALFRSVKCTTEGIWWYALFDYGQGSGHGGYTCGLFPRGHADNPRPAATALRNLCTVCADTGHDRRTFAPGTLAVAPGGVDWDLWQGSDGVFSMPLWRSAREPGGDTVPVTIVFASPVATVEIYNPARDVEPLQVDYNASEVRLDMPAAALIVRVTP